MKQRVATDEKPFKTGSTDDSTTAPPSEEEPAAALVVPPDGGWGWVVVLASFLCNFMIDGVILSAGALAPAIKKEFNESQGKVALVNSLIAGFYLLLGPFGSALANKYGFRMVTIVGSVVASIGFFISYYATSVEYLYVSYGLIGGVGACMIYMPSVLTVGFYFEKWRALATGIALCGSGVGVFVMSPIISSVVATYGWRVAMLCQAGMMLVCGIFGCSFRPIEPVHVVIEEETEEMVDERNKIAADKLKHMMKLQDKLDTGISMPPDMRFSQKVSPHTWMGVPSNTRYPTAAEIFRGSSQFINQRRASATAGTIKNNLGPKPARHETVTEKDEQEEATVNVDNDTATKPLIGSVLKVMSHADYNNRHRSTVDIAVPRPLYRDDIFFGASLNRLPQYTSRTSLGYHLAVTHLPSPEDEREEKDKCRTCPIAVRRALATLLDVSLFMSPTFVILAVGGFFTMLGFFVPFMYVQNRAAEKHMSEEAVGWLVSAIGVANIIGRVGCGLVSSMPKVSPSILTNIALTCGGVATMLSNLSYTVFSQYAFCVVFGFSCACFASMRSIVIVELIGLERLTNCFGLFLLFQGIGAFLGAPIAGALYDMTLSYDVSFYVSGAFMLFSAIMVYPINRIAKWENNRAKAKNVVKIGV